MLGEHVSLKRTPTLKLSHFLRASTVVGPSVRPGGGGPAFSRGEGHLPPVCPQTVWERRESGLRPGGGPPPPPAGHAGNYNAYISPAVKQKQLFKG